MSLDLDVVFYAMDSLAQEEWIDVPLFKDGTLHNRVRRPGVRLNSDQKRRLFSMCSDSEYYDEVGECGTFHLNAGFLINYGRETIGVVELGCGHWQWRFTPENALVNYGAMNEIGREALTPLLDELYVALKRASAR